MAIAVANQRPRLVKKTLAEKVMVKTIVAKLAGENASVVGLDVGRKAVKLVCFKRADGKLSQAEAFRLSREREGIIDDEDLFTHLPEWLSSIGQADAEAAIGIPQHLTTVQITKFPKDSTKALDGMVAFQTRQLAELSDEAFIHDYQVMQRETHGELPVVIGVCLESIIAERAEKYANAGVKVVDFGIASLAMADAFAELKPELAGDEAIRLLLDIGSETSTMVVVGGGRVHFCGALDFGADRYVAAMAPQAGKDDAGARRSLRRTHIRTRDQESQIGQVAQSLVAEIRAGIEYWHEQHASEDEEAPIPEGVWVCGGGAGLPGLVDFLSRSLACDVSLLHVPGCGEAGDGHEFVVAYGLALQAARRSSIALSLAPKALKSHAKRERRANVLLAAVVGLVCFLTLIFALEWRGLMTGDGLLDVELADLLACERVILDLERAAESLKTLETVQLPVLEHGNRAIRFAKALGLLDELKGGHDWFIYLGDREAFDAGKGVVSAIVQTSRQAAGINPFAAPIFELPRAGEAGSPVYPVAETMAPLSGLVAAGYTLLVREEEYRPIREVIEKLRRHPFLGEVDVLAASESLGREDVFSAWSNFLEGERRANRLPHDLKPMTLRLPFAESDITHAPQATDK